MTDLVLFRRKMKWMLCGFHDLFFLVGNFLIEIVHCTLKNVICFVTLTKERFCLKKRFLLIVIHLKMWSFPDIFLAVYSEAFEEESFSNFQGFRCAYRNSSFQLALFVKKTRNLSAVDKPKIFKKPPYFLFLESICLAFVLISAFIRKWFIKTRDISLP